MSLQREFFPSLFLSPFYSPITPLSTYAVVLGKKSWALLRSGMGFVCVCVCVCVAWITSRMRRDTNERGLTTVKSTVGQLSGQKNDANEFVCAEKGFFFCSLSIYFFL